MALVRIACRICGKTVVADDAEPLPAAFPFCSPRCRTIDLGAWATDSYRIAGKPVQGPADETTPGA